MRRIDERTVELTVGEQRAADFFERQLDEGAGIHEAVRRVRTRIDSLGQGYELDEDFYAWLGEP